jgi:hypothetical protein
MARLIEVQDPRQCPSPLAVRRGDVLLLNAAGVRVRSGADAVGVPGPFLPAVVAEDGTVLTPAGPPSTVLLGARRPGLAEVDVVTGDPFYNPGTASLVITVEA